MTTEVQTEQEVKPGEEEVNAGDVTDGVDTAITEEEGTGFSIEDIGSDKEVKTDDNVLKLDGVPDKAQERLNSKIGNYVRDRNVAREEARVAKARIAELEAAQAIPTTKPLAPLERNYDDDSEYQEAMDKYQADIVVYNNALSSANNQQKVASDRVKTNDDRLLVQIDDLQKRFPDTNVEDVIAEVANRQGYGNAASYIANSDHNARIAFFLAKNPVELEKMTALTDPSAINREIGKLEERFSRVRKKTTSAPKSLDTVKGEASTVVKSIYDIKDNSEFLKARNKEMRANKT